MNDKKPREIAVQLLRQHASGADYAESLFDQSLARHSLSPPDRRLLQELVFGVIRWQRTLDSLIAQKTAGRSQKPFLQILLRCGLYQILWMDRIPGHAAVFETVEIAKRAGFGPQSGFINALLRGYLRQLEPTRRALDVLKREQPAVGYSHPDWLCRRWEQRFGSDELRALLEWNNRIPATFARLNTLKGSSDAITSQWVREEVRFTTRPWDWVPPETVYELESHPPLNTLKSFQDGLFYIQDPSTLLAPVQLEVQPGQKVLDLCAAPGGKTTFLAQLMQDRGEIVAADVSPVRLQRVRENCRRLAIQSVRLCSAEDAGTAKYDRILVDAPCSNTGVLRRRVELRWRIQPAELQRLQQNQLGLLRTSAALLNPGGVLVYSTCSLEPEENENVIAAFLAENTAFQLENQRLLLPFRDRADGAYVAKLRRL